MVKTEFHLLQVQKKLSARDTVVSHEIGIAPEVLDPVDVLPPTRRETLSVVDPVVKITLRDLAVVAGELGRVGRVDCAPRGTFWRITARSVVRFTVGIGLG